MTLVDDKRTVEEVCAGYDVTESTTLLMLPTCIADRKTRLVVATLGEISKEDWDTVLTTFPPPSDPQYDFAVVDGWQVITIW